MYIYEEQIKLLHSFSSTVQTFQSLLPVAYSSLGIFKQSVQNVHQFQKHTMEVC